MFCCRYKKCSGVVIPQYWLYGCREKWLVEQRKTTPTTFKRVVWLLQVVVINPMNTVSVVQLWTTGNYHWYLKQELHLPDHTSQEDPAHSTLVAMHWDPVVPLRLHLLTGGEYAEHWRENVGIVLCLSPGGQYLCYSWRWSVAVSSALSLENMASVVVIDGGKGGSGKVRVGLTSFLCNFQRSCCILHSVGYLFRHPWLLMNSSYPAPPFLLQQPHPLTVTTSLL